MRKMITSAALAGSLALAGCGAPAVTGGPPVPPPDFATFFANLKNATLLECQFVPAQAMVIAIFNAGAAAGFQAIADQICSAVNAKAATIVRPAVVINGVRVPIEGQFVK